MYVLIDVPPSLVTYLLAQIRAASRASEDSCSYSLETKWMQSGKSSTLAFLRPRSKMRILASGTPRLNLLLGYCNPVSLLSSSRYISSLTYGLVLAVAVATGGTAGHCDGSSCFEINERVSGERRKTRASAQTDDDVSHTSARGDECDSRTLPFI